MILYFKTHFLLFFLVMGAMTCVKAQDPGWPRQITQDGATLTYYQPQIDSWDNYRAMKARMAFSLTPKGGKQSVGVVSISAATDVNKDTRTAYFHDVKIDDVRFSSLDEQDAANYDLQFRKMMPISPEPIAVDRLLADMQDKTAAPSGVAVKNDPPQIIYSEQPAILLSVEGEPVLSPISKTKLQFVVNTNWDLFVENKTYYLLANKAWYAAKDIKGPYQLTTSLPKDMKKLPAGENFDDVKKMIPPVAGAQPQTIYYSDKPAELVLFKGKPVYTRIPDTQLLYGANTDNDIFLENSTQTYYVLLSGRWFRATTLQGPWTFSNDALPDDFKHIPANSPKARVLASVPGTVEASDAVMLAQIPTTVTVNKKEAAAQVKVQYDGDPQFKPIETTNLQYATNTQQKVIKDGDLYYLCFQGVWFMSTTPSGPWETANAVPKEIYSIPPSSPVYNVTYVTQVSTSETTVESSTTAGYFGMFILGAAIGATIAYGTGFYYPPFIWWGPGALFPVYRPWPMTWGVGAVYNPWNGGFAVGRAAYGPYGAARSAAWYNPATGRYGRSASVQGWYGGRTAASTYNPWTGGYAHTNQGHNAYSQWGSSVATRDGRAIQTGHVTNANGTIAGYRTNTGQSGVIAHGRNGGTAVRTNNGNMYAGHDGNVYKRNGAGNWSQYDNGGWNQVNHPNAGNNISGATRNVSPETMQGLNRAAQNRDRGQFQTQRFQNFQRGGGNFNRGGGGRFRR